MTILNDRRTAAGVKAVVSFRLWTGRVGRRGPGCPAPIPGHGIRRRRRPRFGRPVIAQAEEVRDVFARHGVRYLFIGKSGAILAGYPDTTQALPGDANGSASAPREGLGEGLLFTGRSFGRVARRGIRSAGGRPRMELLGVTRSLPSATGHSRSTPGMTGP
jgi:hypothetical protein